MSRCVTVAETGQGELLLAVDGGLLLGADDCLPASFLVLTHQGPQGLM